MIQNHTELVANNDGRKLFLQSWVSTNNNPQENLLIVHGLGEHSDAYQEIAQILANNINVYALDFTGHGKSSGQRGYVGDIQWLTNDLKLIFNKVDSLTHVLAHSLGGLITVNAIENQLISPKKLILSNPCLGLKVAVPSWKKLGADLLTKTLPRITLGNEISPKDLSKDTSYIETFKKDPLRHQKISPRLYLGMIDLINSLEPGNFEEKTETLLLLSENDPICDPLKSETYFSGHKNKELHIFHNSLHEILNDIEKNQAYQTIKDFIC